MGFCDAWSSQEHAIRSQSLLHGATTSKFLFKCAVFTTILEIQRDLEGKSSGKLRDRMEIDCEDAMMRSLTLARTIALPARLQSGLLLLISLLAFADETHGADKKSAPRKPTSPVSQRSIHIAPVDPATLSQVALSAARIDALVEKNYTRYRIEPNELLSDELFIRRAYLDITGAIPPYASVKRLLAQRDRTWRPRLIDSLLNSDGYASHAYNYWANILRLREDNLQRSVSSEPYNEWIRKSLEENTPYDRWVFEMLAASGRYYDRPETGYLLRDSNMPLDAVNNTARIFLGTQIGCAQCHDHPFDKWSRKQFYEFAAYTFGTSYKRSLADVAGKKHANELMQDLKKLDPKFRGNRYRAVLDGNLIEVLDGPRQLKLPEDYQYDNAKPRDVVQPHTLFDPPLSIARDETPRAALARWITSKDNPRFARTIANRLWKSLLGVGVIEPVDDMKDDTAPENAELMSFLEQEMIRTKFNMKEFLRIVMNTQVYQREASAREVLPGEEYHFPGPILRRMTAEQVWDSFATLASFHDINEYHREPAAQEMNKINLNLKEATAQQLIDHLASYQKDTRNDGERLKRYDYKGLKLVRASELPTPLPEGHFLREFGQSDRQEIEDSHVDGNVLQALQMLNGPITHMLLEESSTMYKNVTAESNIEHRIDVVFLSVLTRRATVEQRRLAAEEIRRHGNAGYGNVIWALVNTPEFLFVQ